MRSSGGAPVAPRHARDLKMTQPASQSGCPSKPLPAPDSQSGSADPGIEEHSCLMKDVVEREEYRDILGPDVGQTIAFGGLSC